MAQSDVPKQVGVAKDHKAVFTACSIVWFLQKNILSKMQGIDNL